VHATNQASSVNFELGFTRASGSNATSLLAQALSPSAKARESVSQEGEFYLSLTFWTSCVLSKDIQDDGGSINRGSTE
jgi:hypothetical protein